VIQVGLIPLLFALVLSVYNRSVVTVNQRADLVSKRLQALTERAKMAINASNNKKKKRRTKSSRHGQHDTDLADLPPVDSPSFSASEMTDITSAPRPQVVVPPPDPAAAAKEAANRVEMATKQAELELPAHWIIDTVYHLKTVIGILFESFQDSCYWWQCVILSRRWLIILIDTLLFINPPAKYMALTIFNFASLMFHMQLQPYRTMTDNRLETVSLTLLTLLSSILTAYPEAATASTYASATAFDTIFLLLILAPSFAGLVLVVLSYCRRRQDTFKRNKHVEAVAEAEAARVWPSIPKPKQPKPVTTTLSIVPTSSTEIVTI